MEEKSYKCEICGFHYNDEATAKKCHDWCSTHQSCSMEITKHSIELSSKK